MKILFGDTNELNAIMLMAFSSPSEVSSPPEMKRILDLDQRH